MKYFYFVVLLVSLSFISRGQVLPDSRSSDWSLAGYKGSIPSYTSVVNISDYGGVGDGISTNDTAFSNAFNALLGENGVVFFPAGVYLFNSNINLRSGIILRGVSSDSTILKFDLKTGNSLDAISISGATTTTTTPLVSDAFRDSVFLNVDNATGFLPGDYLKLSFNDSNLLFSPWAYGMVGQVIKIQNVIGNKILLESPLRLNYNLTANPKITKVDMATGVGIECLKIHRIDTTIEQSNNIVFNYAAQCWVTGIEGYLCNFAHVAINSSTNISILGSYFHDAHAYGEGGQGYGVLCQATSGECLTENNIFKHLRHSMLLQSGANGNVFGYNYSLDPFWEDPILPSNSAGDMVLHGNFPYANLFEGNIGQNIVIDDSHGKNGFFNTFLRNRAELFGIFMNNNPASDGQNFVGNEVNNSTYGFYYLNGIGHFEHGNNIKGTIYAAGTNLLVDSSYYITTRPNFLQHSTSWPSIGIPNTINSGTIPAKERYLISNFTTCSSNSTIGLSKIEVGLDQPIIYPNPAHKEVFISFEDRVLPVDFFIYDCFGQLKGQYRIKEKPQAINVSAFTSGIYFIRAVNKNHTFLPVKLMIR